MSYSACIHGGMCTGCMSCQEEPSGYYNKFGEWVEPGDDEEPVNYDWGDYNWGTEDDEDEEE